MWTLPKPLAKCYRYGMKTLLAFVIGIGASLGAGAIGSFFTMDAIPTWYAFLAKPSINPPNWIFGPVWSVLYVMMGSAAALVYLSKRGGKKLPLTLFGVHLVVNALWSIVFFGLESPLIAYGIIMILWIMIVAMILLFRSYSHPASWLLVPYLLWVSFASILNASIVLLN